MSDTTPTRRAGSTEKRGAILDAARELFVLQGFPATSMDAVAARAGVSKRTVYDYYGDKRGLLLSVVEGAGASALDTLGRLADRHLREAPQVRTRGALRRALVDFAVDLSDSLLGSSDYVVAATLIAAHGSLLPELEDHPLDSAHRDVLAGRFADYLRAGLLDDLDPRLAADHFTALTVLRVLHAASSAPADAGRMAAIAADGVEVFMRAYGPGR